MKREIDLKDISDGKLYGLNDLVKADCNDCTGCSACCQGMGNSIILDPLDIYRLTTNLNCTFDALLADKIELNMVDGIILPNLKMSGREEKCAFLNEEGRCSIHPFRPGICRIFPLGRFYENKSFQYFIQVNECPKPNKTKIKVRKWIDTENVLKNQRFIKDWHYLLNDVEETIKNSKEEETIKKLNLYVLHNFYMNPYDKEIDFYLQFEERYKAAKDCCKL